MKEHVLNASDRAALQGLIPLAGALGAGTIFALFFGGRRRGSGIAVFELFAIVAVLVSVGTTAYLAIALLHQDEAISDKILTQTATPLIFAVFLLVLVSVLGKLPGSPLRIFGVTLPLLIVAGLASAWLASSAWSFRPGETVLMAALVLGVGGLTALLAWVGDRGDSRWERHLRQHSFVRLSVAGYRVAERELQLALPGRRPGDRISLSCWIKKDRVYLGTAACRQLRDRSRARWDGLADGKGRLPHGGAVLTRVSVSVDLLGLVRPHSARLWTFDPDSDEEPRVVDLTANDDGLFDVTERGIV